MTGWPGREIKSPATRSSDLVELVAGEAHHPLVLLVGAEQQIDRRAFTSVLVQPGIGHRDRGG